MCKYKAHKKLQAMTYHHARILCPNGSGFEQPIPFINYPDPSTDTTFLGQLGQLSTFGQPMRQLGHIGSANETAGPTLVSQ